MNIPAGNPGAPYTWTPEQKRNAMLYMRCRQCRAPRELTLERDKDGKLIRVGIICPNGHTQH